MAFPNELAMFEDARNMMDPPPQCQPKRFVAARA